MKTFCPFACLPVLCAALLLAATSPTTAQARPNRYYASVRQEIRSDLLAIPAGTPATDAQKLALSTDLTKLFPYVYPLPTVTIDFLADRLADAVATGAFAPEDTATTARELVGLLGGAYSVQPERLAALQAALTSARVDPALATQITAAVTALPYSAGYNTDTSVSLGNDLSVSNPNTSNYKHASGSVTLVHSVRPTFNRDGTVDNPALLQRSLQVQVNQPPLGRYHVNVTTGPGGATAELGTFGVHSNDPQVTSAVPVGTSPGDITQASGGQRYGYATFSDSGYGKPVPDGVSLDSVTGITITDAQGVVQFTGSLTAAAGALTTRNVNLHLQATAAAPTVGGTIYFMNVQGYIPDRSFTFSAVGLPANATLTLSVNGKAVGPVMTGPTGNLYIKEYGSYFSPAPGITDIVQLLPDAVDLSTAATFILSDAQGNMLASAGL